MEDEVVAILDLGEEQPVGTGGAFIQRVATAPHGGLVDQYLVQDGSARGEAIRHAVGWRRLA